MKETCQYWDEAEIHRVYGGLLLATGERDRAAEQFQLSLASARQRGAGLWELRAACDLARLRGEQGARREAYDLLAPICKRVALQGDVPDSRSARALLANLN